MLSSLICPWIKLRAVLLAAAAVLGGCSSQSSPAILPDLTQQMRPVLSTADQERAIKELAAKKEAEQAQPAGQTIPAPQR